MLAFQFLIIQGGRFSGVMKIDNSLAGCVRPTDHRQSPNDRFRRAPWKGGAFQWVRGPPGDSLQPEAIGAVMEVTKWLKPSISGHNW